MRIMGWVLAGMLALIGPWQPTPAADISVPPGDGTLAAAIAGASDGDTLLLAEGSYTGVATVNKSLAIRAESRAVHPVMIGVLTIAGEGIRVTMQGLTFSNSPVLNQAAAIRLLENSWVNCSLDGTAYKTAEGDGSLIVIGNRFTGGGITNINSEGTYIGGSVILGGSILVSASSWIVGNEISVNSSNRLEDVNAIYALGAVSHIIGNRLFCESANDACVRLSTASGLVANNLIVVRTKSAWNTSYFQSGIWSDSTDAMIFNNLIRGQGEYARRSPAIYSGSPGGFVVGNIVIDYKQATDYLPIGAPEFATVANNLCFNNTASCPDGNGNLTVDPQFADLIDYRLSPTSPAIDAGPPDYPLADLDRTRNDMGIHGGPWSIGQFDAQRDPYTLAPYVYPKFEGISAVQGGEIAVKAIGVARLR